MKGGNMPTKTKITKEMILNTAFEIVKENGLSALTNKEISKRLKCSIQPIYYQFKNTEDLKKELIVKIEKYFHKYILEHTNNEIPVYKQVGLNYINFARRENKLFQILFMTESSLSLNDFVTSDEEDFKELAKYIKICTKLNDDDLKEFHTKMWIFTHGIATLVANDTCILTDNQISQLLSSGFQAFMLLEENDDSLASKEDKLANENIENN